MDLVFPGKLFRSNFGGNSTYAENLFVNLQALGCFPNIYSAKKLNSRVLTGVDEWFLQFRSKRSVVLHYLSDTGPLPFPRRRVITTIHGIASAHNFGIRTPTQENIWRSRVKLAALASRTIISPSNSSANDLNRYLNVPMDKISVIPHGINHNLFNSFRTDDDLMLHEKYPMLPSKYALYIGNMDPRKNLSTLLSAIESKNWPKDLKLVVVGKYVWGERETLDRMLNNSSVVLLGQIPLAMIPPIYRNSELFIFPSLYEGFGFPVLEAMACGTPVISTPRGSIPEVAGNSINYLDNPLDHELLAEMVSYIFLNKAKFADDIANAQSWVKKYSWTQSAASHLEIYQTCL